MEPLNNGHVGDECFVHYSEVVPSSDVLTCIQLLAGGMQFVHSREVVRSSECPLSEVPLYPLPTTVCMLEPPKKGQPPKTLVPNVSIVRRFHCSCVPLMAHCVFSNQERVHSVLQDASVVEGWGQGIR